MTTLSTAPEARQAPAAEESLGARRIGVPGLVFTIIAAARVR